MGKAQMLAAVLCFLLPQIAWGDEPCTPCGGNCGESLGTLRGVDAFSNGARGNCTGTGRGFYQCVEYVKRFNGRTGERWGNANQIFDRAERLGLRSFRNGETEAPRQGDAITFRGGRYGHIAIIYETGSNFVTLIEQNWHNVSGHFRRLSMNVDSGHYTVVSDSRNYTVEGWLRPVIDPTLTDDDGDTISESEGDCDDTNPNIHPEVRDICDYLDNDCDGATDEGFGLIGESCVRWVLECRVEGVFVCSADGLGEECDFSPPLIEAERCDGIDNNCDGATDEDWPWLGVACESGFGECRTSGAWVCEPLFELSTFCDAHVPLGSPEICDGLDNDCDTETDEDWPELGSACGIYPCDGTYVCSLGGSGSYCNSDPGMPEVCDGLDNDCDGETDEYPAELSCADTSDCTEDICLFGLCQNVARDRDHDTYTDDLCGGSDCNDLNPAVWEYTFFESRLTNFPGDSSVPVLVWTGAELGVAWEDWRESTSNAEIYFARADTTLTRIGDEVRVTNAPWQSRGPSLVWSGSEYGIAWMDYRDTNDVYFARLDVVGSKIGSETSVTDRLSFPGYSYNPALAWTGSEFGLSFLDNRVRPIDIYFIRLNSDGMAIAPEAPVVSDSWTENNPVLVWTGTQYGLAYTVSTDGYQQVFFVRIDSSGGRIGGVTSVAEFDSLGRLYAETVDLVWQGSEFALVWTKNMASGTKEAYFRRLDATGVPLAPEVLVASSSDTIYSVALVWTGSEYGLTCSASSTSLARAHFVRLDRNGASFGSEIELSSNQRISEKVAVVWIGHEHVMAWSDNRDGDWEIYLGRVGCGW